MWNASICKSNGKFSSQHMSFLNLRCQEAFVITAWYQMSFEIADETDNFKTSKHALWVENFQVRISRVDLEHLTYPKLIL
jgi:hypothetical protein